MRSGSSVGRIPACQVGGRGFKSLSLRNLMRSVNVYRLTPIIVVNTMFAESHNQSCQHAIQMRIDRINRHLLRWYSLTNNMDGNYHD